MDPFQRFILIFYLIIIDTFLFNDGLTEVKTHASFLLYNVQHRSVDTDISANKNKMKQAFQEKSIVKEPTDKYKK